jgi:hypothetical protein
MYTYGGGRGRKKQLSFLQMPRLQIVGTGTIIILFHRSPSWNSVTAVSEVHATAATMDSSKRIQEMIRHMKFLSGGNITTFNGILQRNTRLAVVVIAVVVVVVDNDRNDHKPKID